MRWRIRGEGRRGPRCCSPGFLKSTWRAGAAPHCPAGHFSPYSDGEKDACADDFRQSPKLQKRMPALRPAPSPRSPEKRANRLSKILL
ncbi:MAG: hypothetical protein E5V58_19140 [Mesorhizobium sp.]|nr:MAG: hypothetical protein EOS32_09270 [Mesorhizobium sp.]TIW71452.1 MAG: hypothetical protein E5V58_19140 [Mesorhizobium sp.]